MDDSLSARDNSEDVVNPFLRWAGGKRWLVFNYPSIFPTKYNRYIEPFLGSGSVFFHLRPKRSILSDINSDLIATYEAVKNDWEKVYSTLIEHHICHSIDYYYNLRLNKPTSRNRLAAWFIYLNRTCWNGLYRVSEKGIFNVPIGTKVNVILPTDNFKASSKILRNADLRNADFEEIIDSTKRGDLIFADPPYTVKHENNGFIKYNGKLFSWNDQIRLRNSLLRAKQRGVIFLLTNACHDSIRNLYSDFCNIVAVERSSVIAAETKNRKICKEYVIMG